MISKRVLSSILALAVVSSAGAAFATTPAPAAKKPTIVQECKKEFGADKAKVKHCIQAKKKAAAAARKKAEKPAAAPATTPAK